MHWRIAWDEYMTTGIDPTGGDLGPDFDIETGRYFDEQEEETYYRPVEINKTAEEYLDEIIEGFDRIIKAHQSK